jgi:hypothetical protein
MKKTLYQLWFTASLGMLTTIFIVLKTLGFISWSWVQVLSPLWIYSGVCVALTPVMIYSLNKTIAKVKEAEIAMAAARKMNKPEKEGSLWRDRLEQMKSASHEG